MTIRLARSPFDQFASDRGYDVALAVLPAPDRVYADRQTQAAYEAWLDGARYVTRMHFDSTFNTETSRDKIREFMGDA